MKQNENFKLHFSDSNFAV